MVSTTMAAARTAVAPAAAVQQLQHQPVSRRQSRQQRQQSAFGGAAVLRSQHALPALRSHSRRTCRAAVAAAENAAAATNLERPTVPTTFHFVVGSSKFLLDELEELKELLVERARYFAEKGFEQNFWLVQEPAFLDTMPEVKVPRPCTAIVSFDETWIRFMKLRIDRVQLGKFEAPSDKIPVALASKQKVKDFGKPENWVAPYKKYEAGWWEKFEPKDS
eukprot:jgi/Chlat1/1373/Chrsp119S01785